MKVDKVTGGHVPQPEFQQTSRGSVKTLTPVRGNENVFNNDIAAIEQAQVEMVTLPDIDMAKVEQFRNALSRGELGLDTKALSKAILQFHTGHE
ncbi:flagellar biosynthesis anti-sigma factor FlgM [Vibrio mimicus]